MKKYLTTLLLAVFFVPSFICAQENIKMNKSEFKTEDEGFRDAWKSIKEGDRLFSKGKGLFPEAAVCYELANNYNSESAALNYKIGLVYLYGKEPVKALDFFLKAYDIDPEITDDILLLTGKSYQSRGDYGKAIDCYNMYSDKYLSSDLFRSEVNELINQCNKAISFSTEEIVAEIINAGKKINSEYDDYSAVPASGGDALYFTSRRPAGESRDRQSQDMKWDENIYVSLRDKDGWTNSGMAGDRLNTILNEGVLHVVANGQLMYLYAGYEGQGDILVSEYDKGRWNKPYEPGIKINSSKRETSIAVTADNNEIFFTSNRRKSIGGRDIFYIKRVRRNKWTKPYNLGEKVNSTYNEEAVSVSPGGDTIWFSSNRKGGMGGYDIYMSLKDDIGLWSDPVNLGVPANSQANDLFYRRLSTGKAWLSSDRAGGEGGLDIYRLFMKEAIKQQPDTLPAFPDITDNDTISVEPDTLSLKIKRNLNPGGE